MQTLIFSFIVAMSCLGYMFTNPITPNCGLVRSSPKSGFALKSGEIYVFVQTNNGPFLSKLRIVEGENNRTMFIVKEGYPKIEADWSKQDFPHYSTFKSYFQISPHRHCPPAVLVFPARIGLVNYAIATLELVQWLEWYQVLMNGTQSTFKDLENEKKAKFESYFWEKSKHENLVEFSLKTIIDSTIRIYSIDPNNGLFNIAYIDEERRKRSYYFEYDFAEDKVKYLQDISRSLQKNENGQFVAYDIPEKNASFGYRFIESYSIPTIYYANMTEVSIMNENGEFNQEFRQHVTKQEQLFIVSSEIWLGCPPFIDCLHLHIDALAQNLEGQPLIFSGKYINALSTDCEIGRKISHAFQNAPNNIDAAFKDRTQHYFIFKDGMVFHYRHSKSREIDESTSMPLNNTYSVQELFHTLPHVTAALYLNDSSEFVYIFTDILNEKESQVWQYQWKNDGQRVQAKLLRIVKISFIHKEMPAAIDAATVFKNEIIIVKDSFYLSIGNRNNFYQWTLNSGFFEPLANSRKLGCNKVIWCNFKWTFWRDYFAYQRPTPYKKNETVSSQMITYQTKKYTKPFRLKPSDYFMLISIPFLILVIACSIYLSFPKRSE